MLLNFRKEFKHFSLSSTNKSSENVRSTIMIPDSDNTFELKIVKLRNYFFQRDPKVIFY